MNIRSKFNKYWRSFIHSVYPWHCKVCAKRCESSAEQGICELCQPQLPFCNQTCNRCGAPLSTVSLGTHTICGQCLSQPPFYDHVYAAFWYQEPIDQLISELKYQKRRRNVRNVFAVRKALKSDHIILFDDVMTSGASANECAKVLKQAGAKHVQVWCLARAHRDWNMCLNQP